MQAPAEYRGDSASLVVLPNDRGFYDLEQAEEPCFLLRRSRTSYCEQHIAVVLGLATRRKASCGMNTVTFLEGMSLPFRILPEPRSASLDDAVPLPGGDGIQPFLRGCCMPPGGVKQLAPVGEYVHDPVSVEPDHEHLPFPREIRIVRQFFRLAGSKHFVIVHFRF